MYVGLSEEVSYLPDFGSMICKDGPFYVVIAFCPITLIQVSMLMLICYIFYRTHVPVATVLVLNTPDDGRLRPKHVE